MNFKWNPNLYDNNHDFVFKYGEEVVELLHPQKHETILDLGCGTGDLTKKIAELSKKVIGIDNSLEMVRTARNKYPNISFQQADARDFKLQEQFDAVFSNAVLHWVPQADKVINNVNQHLKIGGRFVVEFGGKGCNNATISMLTHLLDENNFNYPAIKDSIYFPSISEYSGLLEKTGFEVNYALLFDRPTELKGGTDGLTNFIEMFLNWLFKEVADADKKRIIQITNEKLKHVLFNGTSWIADYRRIRVAATKKQDK